MLSSKKNRHSESEVALSLLVEGVEDPEDPPTGPRRGNRLKRLSEEPPLNLLVMSLKTFGLNWSP